MLTSLSKTLRPSVSVKHGPKCASVNDFNCLKQSSFKALVPAGVLVGDVEVALEDRKLALVNLNFVVVVGQGRRLLGAVSAAGKLKLHVERSTLLDEACCGRVGRCKLGSVTPDNQ